MYTLFRCPGSDMFPELVLITKSLGDRIFEQTTQNFERAGRGTIMRVAIQYEYHRLRASKTTLKLTSQATDSARDTSRGISYKPSKLTDYNLGSQIKRTENKIIKNYDSQKKLVDN